MSAPVLYDHGVETDHSIMPWSDLVSEKRETGVRERDSHLHLSTLSRYAEWQTVGERLGEKARERGREAD